MLLRFDTRLPGGIFAETKKATDLITQFRHGFEVRLKKSVRHISLYDNIVIRCKLDFVNWIEEKIHSLPFKFVLLRCNLFFAAWIIRAIPFTSQPGRFQVAVNVAKIQRLVDFRARFL